MFPARLQLCLLLALCSWLLAPVAPCQAYKSDVERSQNTAQDLANSLTPGKPNLTKGEKKTEIDPKTLQSKKIHDKTFDGGLADIGVDWSGDKMGKPTNSKTSKQSDVAAEKEASKQTDASAEKNSNALKSTAVDPNKTERAEDAKPAQKSAEKEKSAKPEGN